MLWPSSLKRDKRSNTNTPAEPRRGTFTVDAPVVPMRSTSVRLNNRTDQMNNNASMEDRNNVSNDEHKLMANKSIESTRIYNPLPLPAKIKR